MKKIFTLWSGALVTILISVPAIAGVIQLSHVAALIAYMNNHAVVAVVILIGGYALIWTTFKKLDAVAGQLGDVAASATGRIQKSLSNYRGNTLKKRTGEAVEGKRTIRGAGAAVGTIRRFQNADNGGLSMTRRGQARYAAVEAQHMNHTVDDIMKKDGGRSGGDDDLMEIAMQRGMDPQRAEQQYAARIRGRIRAGMQADVNNGTMTAGQADARADAESARRAESAVAGLQTNFGAQLGTDAMRVAAYKSLLNSKTSYQDPDGTNEQQNLENIINDGAQLMNDGLITATDATSFVKQRADRADRSGIGFGSLQNAFETAQTRIQHGAAAGNAANPLITQSEARNLRREALFGTQAGGIVGGRHEAVSALSGVMRDDTEEASTHLDNSIVAATAAGITNQADEIAHAQAGNAAIAAGGTATVQQQAAIQTQQAREAFDRQLASIAGRYDAMGQVSPQNATIMANNVMSQMVFDPTVGQQVTIQQAIENARSANRPGFVEMRREYMNAGMAAAAGGVVAAGAGGAGGGGGGSDRRLKRNIEPIGTFKDIQLYRFQYLWSDQVYVGVMAQDLFETHPEAIITHSDGFYRVNYRLLGTRMYTLEEWEEKNRLPQLTR
jgi:hypothetical protein